MATPAAVHPSSAAYVVVRVRDLVLRVVPPYLHVFQTHVKKRWCGWTLQQVYERDFLAARDYDTQGAILRGCIRVNGQPCHPDRLVLHDDVVSHPTHRHEPPALYVSARDMVLFDDGDLLVVDKPPSIPIHAGGQYKRNSLVSILQAELDLPHCKPIHRLDRLVSGLVLFARTAETARRMTSLLSPQQSSTDNGDRVQKTYVARVRGRWRQAGEREWVSVSAPIAELDARRGQMQVCFRTGKESTSRFALLGYCADTDTSLVQCEPLTGRTHQLRLHLRHLGHPIPNDPLYGNTGEGAAAAVAVEDDEEEDAEYAAALHQALLDHHHHHVVAPEEEDAELLALAVGECHMCPPRPPKFPKSIRGIFLHSIRVRRIEQGNKLVFEYQGRMPEWASSNVVLMDDY